MDIKLRKFRTKHLWVTLTTGENNLMLDIELPNLVGNRHLPRWEMKLSIHRGRAYTYAFTRRNNADTYPGTKGKMHWILKPTAPGMHADNPKYW